MIRGKQILAGRAAELEHENMDYTFNFDTNLFHRLTVLIGNVLVLKSWLFEVILFPISKSSCWIFLMMAIKMKLFSVDMYETLSRTDLL